MANLAEVLVQLQDERKRKQSELKRLENAISALRGVSHNNVKSIAGRPRRRLSLAARRRIAAAQRARWAKFKALKKVA